MRALEGRVAIVTGGGFRVGRAVACAFAAAGARVVVAARTAARLDETVAMIAAAGGDALAVPTDCAEPAQVDALVATTIGRFGTIDVLAAAAGGGSVSQPIDALAPAAWDAVFRANVTTAFLTIRGVLPSMRGRNRGAILTFVGRGTFHPDLDVPCTAYAAANAALARLTDQLTAELLDTAIRPNAIEPGPVGDGPGQVPLAAVGELATWLASDASAPLRGRLVATRDAWWRDPAAVAAVDATIHRYRLRRVE